MYSFVITFTVTAKELSLLCLAVGPLWEEDELFGLLLLDAVIKVEHGVDDLYVL